MGGENGIIIYAGAPSMLTNFAGNNKCVSLFYFRMKGVVQRVSVGFSVSLVIRLECEESEKPCIKKAFTSMLV